ncbi:methyl-accepting chemotaxis protein [Halovivax gelatinilyticus]|uniref:methyl-accepting chemotaxis protein n=1 Tax=Halovivax gelatinilyticus TaxID=2961597 RepID=UPI0020CA6773|nr:methyl-accepting chemotaxis protein [Halovivax gelatinilyticus]
MSPSRFVPNVVRRRYLTKFVISILAVVVVIGLVGLVTYAEVDGSVTAESNDQLERTAEMQAGTIGDWVELLSVQTSQISASDPLTEGDVQDVQGHLVESNARMSVEVRAIHYVDTDAEEIVTSTDSERRDGVSLHAIDEPWTAVDFEAELSFDDDVWHTPRAYEDELLEDEVMAFASPVPERPDRVAVVIGTLEYRLEALQQPAAEAATTIVDESGEPITRADASPVRAGAVDDEALQAAIGGRSSLLVTDDTAFAYVPVADTGWVAVTTVPTDEAYGVADSVGQHVLLLLLTSVLALGLMGTILGRQTVRPLTELRDRTEAMESGDLDVDLETGRIDEIGHLYDGFDTMRTSLKRQIDEANRAREEAEGARAETTAINHQLEETATTYGAVMAECADGDLTRRLDPDDEHEAMAEIAHSFNVMVATLEASTASAQSFATAVDRASQSVTGSAQEVEAAASQMSTSVQEISEGTDLQHANLQTVSDEVDGLSTTTEQIAAASNQVADVAERTAQAGTDGRKAAQDAIDGMAEIQSDALEAREAIEALEAEMAEIDELAEFIQTVAYETNMLALNANIEASRDGGDSAGGESGFAVVADEIKELSAETKSIATDIEDRIEVLTARTDRTSREVERTASRIDEHVASVQNAAVALDRIAEYAAETNDGVQEISAATEQQAAATEEIVAMVASATDIANETAVETEQVAAAAAQQTSAISAVSHRAEGLSEQASRLSEALDGFETAVETESDETAGSFEFVSETADIDQRSTK